MTTKLKISPTFSLPLEFTTRTQAILAKKGAGKTNTAVVETEELLAKGQQVVIVDPTGGWWGLKSSADGKSEGFSVAIFGGEHGDVELDEHAGEIVAEAIVMQRFSAIVDLSLFRKGAMHRFMAAFLETLYRKNREAMHLVIDEADTFAPQKPFGEEARTLGAMQDIVRRGRIRGIGCTLITQRPQVLNKDVLTQADMLCAMRMGHPKDINAVMEWVNVHADPKVAKEMIVSLPALPTGTGWFWSPDLGIFEKVGVRARKTFDSSATPKVGEKVKAPKVVAEIDLKRLGDQISAVVRKKKENDPKELKKKIAELEMKLKSTSTPAPPMVVEIKEIEIPVITKDQLAILRDVGEKISVIGTELLASINKVINMELRQPQLRRNHAPPAPAYPNPAPPTRNVTNVTSSNGDHKLSKVQRKILSTLAQYPNGMEKNKLAIIAGYAPSGGGFANGMSECRTNGWIDGSPLIIITREGLQAIGNNVDPLPDGEQLWSHWMGQLTKAEKEILNAMKHAIGPMSKEQIAERTDSGYSPDGGGFANAMSRLRTLELISGKGSEIKLCDELKVS